ncbi:hypothetical protein K435DRAFT_796926 [Dendrothele bispora CBS 962.96]|uniref:Secreted protein n=1 Tax=Dendrothele bispora (strain CBS 962.96) TaxID=1314807 RepID=A0A4V4HG03_DENBC|nr:hypothetical protein K435DRAFT_796926 [Dendrothele bispora CBS 962.96]
MVRLRIVFGIVALFVMDTGSQNTSPATHKLEKTIAGKEQCVIERQAIITPGRAVLLAETVVPMRVSLGFYCVVGLFCVGNGVQEKGVAPEFGLLDRGGCPSWQGDYL